MNNNLIPKEITQDCDTGKNVASFSYSIGIQYAKENNLKQNLEVNGSLFNKNGFCVCCGDVMTEVEPTDFPNIIRRIF